MNFLTYLILFWIGIVGMLFHLFAVKIPSVKKAATAANMTFTYKAFFQDEMAALLANVIAIIVVLVVLDELVKIKPEIVPYLKIGFLFVGFTGSSLVLTLMGKASDKINSIVDVKTNIADQVEPPAPPTPNV